MVYISVWLFKINTGIRWNTSNDILTRFVVLSKYSVGKIKMNLFKKFL